MPRFFRRKPKKLTIPAEWKELHWKVHSKSSHTRHRAACELATLIHNSVKEKKPIPKAASALLEILLKDDSTGVLRKALTALAERKDAYALKKMRSFLDHRDWRIAKTARTYVALLERFVEQKQP